MRKIDPALLRTFITVVETGSLRSAAKIVEKTVSAVFYQVQRLEAALGQDLFLREKRGLIPTEAGRKFLGQAHSLLQTHDQVLAGAWSIPSQSTNNENHLNAVSKNRVGSFDNVLDTRLFQDAFSIWKSYRADGRTASLDDILDSGIITNDTMYMCFEQSEWRCLDASESPKRLFQIDKYGFGVTPQQLWKSPRICDTRLKVFSLCRYANTPVFFSGNAAIPWHSDYYSATIDEFSSTRLDRLLLPVRINSDIDEKLGVLQVLQMRDRLQQPIKCSDSSSAEERAASINIIGEITVAI